MKKSGTELITTKQARQFEYLDHIMRNERRYGLLQNILKAKILAKRGPGRRNLSTWLLVATTAPFRTAANEVVIARMFANIWTE
ncbi:hypothetical protein Trydic_g11521 [Trypoxylus dichotomus]